MNEPEQNTIISVDNSESSNEPSSNSANSSAPTNFDHDYGHGKKSNNLSQESLKNDKFNLLGSPLRSFIDPISSSAEEPWVIKCICNSSDDVGDMICCDTCNVWQHISCVGLDSSHIPDKYFCTSCLKKIDPNLDLNIDILKQETLVNNINSINSVYTEIDIMNPSEFVANSIQENISLDSNKEKAKNDLQNIEEYEKPTCDCLIRIFKSLSSQHQHPDLDYFDIHARNKNCHSYTLKNGQKILKSSKNINAFNFVCEIKGDAHILGSCHIIDSTYNAFSSFIYTLNIGENIDIAIDTRTSSHVSRYIRRSCLPNTKLTCTIDPDIDENIRIFLYSLNDIEKHHEITMSVDRSSNYFQQYPSKTIKHHWQKYDYTASLICNCPNDVSHESCSVEAIKNYIRTIKNGKKTYENNADLSPQMDINNISYSDEEVEPIQDTKGLTREEKKFNYWLRLIDKMESNNIKKLKRKARKTLEQEKEAKNEDTAKLKATDIPPEVTSNFSSSQSNISPESNKHNDNEVRPTTPNEVSWFFPQKITNFLVENAATVRDELKKLDTPITAHRKTQFPISLALRRGLYHLVYNQIFESNSKETTPAKVAEDENLPSHRPRRTPTTRAKTPDDFAQHRWKKLYELREKFGMKEPKFVSPMDPMTTTTTSKNSEFPPEFGDKLNRKNESN